MHETRFTTRRVGHRSLNECARRHRKASAKRRVTSPRAVRRSLVVGQRAGMSPALEPAQKRSVWLSGIERDGVYESLDLLRELANSGEVKGDTTTLEDLSVIARLQEQEEA